MKNESGKTGRGPGDWRGQMRAAWRSPDALKERFPSMRVTDAMRAAAARFPMAVTPHYASLVRTPDFSDPVFAQCVPSPGELVEAPWASADPLGEVPSTPVPHLVRRYPDRAVLLAATSCACYCRHCFRKRVSGAPDAAISPSELAAAAGWLRTRPEVSDVLVSGGDPLTLSDSRIRGILETLASVPSVRVVRVGSRLPAVLPQRFTPALVRILAAPARRPGGPAVYLMAHFNHARELSPESLAAMRELVDRGVPVCSQTVLLRGVNDDADTLEELFRALYHARIRPYYLFQSDLAPGIEHLRTPLETGPRLMRELRARLSGPALPNFCLDPPGGGGKIELSPDSVVRRSPGATLLRNGRGEEFLYPDPDPSAGGVR
ncbi:MAG: KamA family radical SAM protein [Kiritimatiellae bacterium]|nr:KamA family radical SAM protein [Kiritimatiellia bacterium]